MSAPSTWAAPSCWGRPVRRDAAVPVRRPHHDLGRQEKRLAGTINHLRVLLDADTDLDDAAALCDLADLVVTVDTSFAHIAGTLGKPVFVMLKYTPDFRWMMHRSDSPWYDGMTLFRQQDRGDWETPIRDVMAALQTHLGSGSGKSSVGGSNKSA